MIDDMTARQVGPQTQQVYIRSCRRFAAFLGRSPDTVRLLRSGLARPSSDSGVRLPR
jgi:hypothetical protein